MLLILLIANCIAGQPDSCHVTSMRPFATTEVGIHAACDALLAPGIPENKKVLVVMYAKGLNIKLAPVSGACVAPEKSNPTEFRETFLENVEK